ncbi:hypothetical protein PUN28_011576 [Cardiocondyla obscurior]|uniref:Uncharacterized protein n=1 Tax=Cardiocondyla obscurior TaxID=286306 RepID=A0AAW2FEY7_9HYME
MLLTTVPLSFFIKNILRFIVRFNTSKKIFDNNFLQFFCVFHTKRLYRFLTCVDLFYRYFYAMYHIFLS